MSTRITRRPRRRHLPLGVHSRMQILAGILLLFVAMPGAWRQQHGNLRLTIMDPDGNRLADAQISVRLDGREVSRATSNGQGVVVVSNIPAGMYELVIEKPGFQTNLQALSVDGHESGAEVTLLPKIARSQKVEVRADADGSANNQVAASQSLQREEVNSLPSRPPTVTDALPLLPGVTRSADGEIVIDVGAEHNSAFLVNGTDVTDPGTGRFDFPFPWIVSSP